MTGRPDWDRLYVTAAEQSGYFTTKQAAAAGFSRPLLDHHLRRGRIERARRTVYRLVRWPTGEHEGLVVLWLWTERAGVFSHETALTLHGLSDALPMKTHIALPAAWRRRRLRTPAGIVLHHADVPPGDRAWSGAVPVTSPARTVLDCAADQVPPDLVAQAIEEGRARGLFSREAVAPAIAYLRAFRLAD